MTPWLEIWELPCCPWRHETSHEDNYTLFLNQQHTSSISKRVVPGRSKALRRADPKHPVKAVSQGILPATSAILKGAGSPTFTLVCIIPTVVFKITALFWSVTLAILALPLAMWAGAWKEKNEGVLVNHSAMHPSKVTGRLHFRELNI